MELERLKLCVTNDWGLQRIELLRNQYCNVNDLFEPTKARGGGGT